MCVFHFGSEGVLKGTVCVCVLGVGGGRHSELVENEQLETLPGERGF